MGLILMVIFMDSGEKMDLDGLGAMEKTRHFISFLRQGLGLFLLTGLFLGLAASAFAELDTPYGKVRVRTQSWYRVQWSNPPEKELTNNNSSDQDFNTQVGIDWDWADKGVTMTFLGRYRKDLDGTPEGSIFQDYIDACGDQRQEFNVYYGYLDFQELIPNFDIRIGRQDVYGVNMSYQVDGLWIRGDRAFGLDWFSFEAYGGMPSQPYANLRKDGIGGFNLEFYPVKNLVLHADTSFYKENAWEVYGDWRPYPNLMMDAHGAFINNHARYAYFDAVGDVEKTGTTLSIKVYRNFENEYDSDFIFDWQSPEKSLGKDIKNLYLSRELAYYQVTFSISQQIPTQEGLGVFTRFSFRKLANSDEENLYNTDFTSWTAGISVDDWEYLEGFHCSLGVTRWWENRETFYEGDSISFFADLSQKFFHNWEIAGGYYYKSEDVNSMIENEAANNYYGALRYHMNEDRWAELKYQYERDDYYKEYGITGINGLTATVNINF